MKSVKKINNKNYLAYSKINTLPMYKFLLISTLKSSLWLCIVLILTSIIFPILYFHIIGGKFKGENYLFFGLGYVFLMNSLFAPSAIIFFILAPIRFSDLQSRIALLSFKNLGYLLINFLVIVTWLIVADLCSVLTFSICIILYHLPIIFLYNWPVIFLFISSILFCLIFVSIFLLLTITMPTVKSIGIYSLFLFSLPMVVFFQIFNILPAILNSYNFSQIADKLNHIFLSSTALMWYIFTIILTIILTIGSIFLFNKFYTWKK